MSDWADARAKLGAVQEIMLHGVPFEDVMERFTVFFEAFIDAADAEIDAREDDNGEARYYQDMDDGESKELEMNSNKVVRAYDYASILDEHTVDCVVELDNGATIKFQAYMFQRPTLVLRRAMRTMMSHVEGPYEDTAVARNLEFLRENALCADFDKVLRCCNENEIARITYAVQAAQEKGANALDIEEAISAKKRRDAAKVGYAR